MPVSWWAVKATLNNITILDEDIRMPSYIVDEDDVLNSIALTDSLWPESVHAGT